MKASDIVNQLRTLIVECEEKSVQLPIEMVAIINGKQPEVSWQWIGVGKVLQYVSDMLEE